MASYQRVALFILFDSLERDIVAKIRDNAGDEDILTLHERDKALPRLERREDCGYDLTSDFDLLYGLDLGEKFQVLLRQKANMDETIRRYYLSIASSIQRCIPIRNHIMHGRQLTVQEHIFALDFAQSLLSSRSFWPTLHHAYLRYNDDPTTFLTESIRFLDDPTYEEVRNNLPVPDYDDTGFLSRPELERELKKKITGRHPVVTILGEGGNGKTALALRVLYGMVQSHDHDFDAIIWVTAKTAELNVAGVREIENVATSALDIIGQAVRTEQQAGTPLERLIALLSESRILLVIDNYETIIGDEIARLAEDVPGESKLLFTSRLPIGSDLTVLVGELPPPDGFTYFKRLVQAYGVTALRNVEEGHAQRILARLNYKPLLIKWLVLGVQAGLDPDVISMQPDTAMRFCLDNVILRLSAEAAAVIVVLATLPVAATSTVIERVSPLNGQQVTDGIAQLLRYGLVDLEISPEGEKLHRVKSFSRSYINRLIPTKAETTDRIISEYRALDSEYNAAKTQGRDNPYSIKVIQSQTRSRVLTAQKLREALAAAARQEYELADQIIVEQKMLDSTFFEIHRIEGFVAQWQNDSARSLAAFETAVSLAPDQPQLYFFTAMMLLRLSENEEAASYLLKAYELDPDAAIVHREIARNEMIRANFDVAQTFVEKCLALESVSTRDQTIAADLQIQLYVRKAEHMMRLGDHGQAERSLQCLLSYLRSIDLTVMDERMTVHLFKVDHTLRALTRVNQASEIVAHVRRFLIDYFPTFATRSDRQASFNADPAGAYNGVMRPVTASASYGFLTSTRGGETFVHIKTVSPTIWAWMLNGGAVSFDVEPFQGRERACNVAKLADHS